MPLDLSPLNAFARRHIGPSPTEIKEMLTELGESSLDRLMERIVPASIRLPAPLAIPAARSEEEMLEDARAIAAMNSTWRSLLGMGYYGTNTPGVILRNILENPGWYTAYTPYQAEIAQGRLEALLNFQTMVTDLTGMELANASLLDEGTAAAEAMSMFHATKGHPAGGVFFVSEDCHPQTVAVIQTRAIPLGITVEVGNHASYELSGRVFGALLQYPATDGEVVDYRDFIARAHSAGALVVMATDLLALALLIPPGEMDADCAVGSAQRFGVPMGYGGPHAAFFATREEFKRHLPGRIIGVSVDSHGRRALRMALQTREQHIRREKATSNICTAQVLLAVMAGMYAVYHGPDGIRQIATRVHDLARLLADALIEIGHTIVHRDYFDTLRVIPAAGSLPAIQNAARAEMVNLREFGDGSLGIALDELSSQEEVGLLVKVFASHDRKGADLTRIARAMESGYAGNLRRTSAFLQHPVFTSHHSETRMLRYIHLLEQRDLALNTSMIPLGSCTMKLNATSEMAPVTWPEFASLHPFAPAGQAAGYREMFGQLADWLKAVTGFPAVSLQPNAGAQGEYTGLLVIRAYHKDRGEGHRNVCLIPSSAHGTNPASAVMAGMQVVVVKCDERGNVDCGDLREKARQHGKNLAALMVTYPSTHGVFEESIREVCAVVHEHGGQVYMDGANMNAQVGLTSPAAIGADVCHLNLHKTFCIPHGGGGPGMGPIAAAGHLAPFLPGHPVVTTGGERPVGAVSSAPWGSAGILVIPWAYIAMMGPDGLTQATRVAILNANYMARRLEHHYPILYRGASGAVAHEFILDLRPLKDSAGVEAEDFAKRLMDYGFHAPTVSFPVAGTLMIEPTESESREELDRFCEAMIRIRQEVREIEEGLADREDNVLKNAPHTAEDVISGEWKHPYSREKAAYPAPWTRNAKFWPFVGRINNAHGDRNLICVCPPLEVYEAAP